MTDVAQRLVYSAVARVTRVRLPASVLETLRNPKISGVPKTREFSSKIEVQNDK